MKILIISGIMMSLSGCITFGDRVGDLPAVQIRQCLEAEGSPDYLKDEQRVIFNCTKIIYVQPISGVEPVQQWGA